MRMTFITLPFAIAAASMPAFAGNGTNRPVPAAQDTVVAQVDARPSAELKSSALATIAQVPARQKTRAEVHAEAVAWTKSGMGEMVYGEVPYDSRGPSFDRAARSFQKLSQEQAARAGK